MSERLIGRSADLKRLRDEGYEVEVRHGFLVVHSVPYVNAQKQVVLGTIVTDLTLNNDKTDKPADHQVWFAGDHPCNSDGTTITQIKHTTSTTTLCDGVIVQHRFSCKPQIGYPDYHAKITRYIEIIQNQAKAVDPKADARTFKPISSSDEDSVFLYLDSASSRAGIANVTRRTAMAKLAIIGLGGSGGYVLDFVAKTNVREIHLFDGDVFLQHNAFRAPSAVSLQELDVRPKKVDYFARLYGQMRRGIFTHPDYVTEENVENLAGFDFAFICVDKPAVRKLLSEYLTKARVPFVDTGMELELLEEEQCLIGTCRVTLSTSDKFDHFSKHVSLDNGAIADDLYATNIQVAELNALCAVMAVIKWKKFCGFYQDCYGEHQSAYVINTHQLTRDEITRNKPE